MNAITPPEAPPIAAPTGPPAAAPMPAPTAAPKNSWRSKSEARAEPDRITVANAAPNNLFIVSPNHCTTDLTHTIMSIRESQGPPVGARTAPSSLTLVGMTNT